MIGSVDCAQALRTGSASTFGRVLEGTRLKVNCEELWLREGLRGEGGVNCEMGGESLKDKHGRQFSRLRSCL